MRQLPYERLGTRGAAGDRSRVAGGRGRAGCSVLDFGLDPIAAAEAPQVHLYATPFLAEVLEGTPEAPLHARIVIEGEFDDALLEAVRARGQPVLELPAPRVTPIRGWGVTATVDPVTGRRTGAASRFSGGLSVAVPPQ